MLVLVIPGWRSAQRAVSWFLECRRTPPMQGGTSNPNKWDRFVRFQASVLLRSRYKRWAAWPSISAEPQSVERIAVGSVRMKVCRRGPSITHSRSIAAPTDRPGKDSRNRNRTRFWLIVPSWSLANIKKRLSKV